MKWNYNGISIWGFDGKREAQRDKCKGGKLK